ncbi:DUF4327 family protein [Leptolyngbya sp. FACHB-261]|uniref:DUF4327 family protein n=1 Tax=Leptolyngbya sp. FACHB-261 TaxID=2692806 RepID=UPI001686A907|nr:DUF4327 family protein [Leptolyngbya sp. FACHB-261]MBD2101042.1 DUF4327 family protein [Leptolyngbya sp. FACHB-261]
MRRENSGEPRPVVSPSLYSLAVIQEEVYQLVREGIVNRHQPIYVLSQYISKQDWIWIERELEARSFVLKDHISELLSNEVWEND